ncbi:MAG: hypothetical protein MI724_17140 [Spirochaetales bacterium]|nr:hypothetical protein [Spirochaetales bacterium]
MRRLIPGPVALTLLCAVVIPSVAILMILAAPMTAGMRPWHDFDVMLVPAGEGYPTVAAERLRAASFDVVTLSEAAVLIEDFNGGDTVQLSEIEERFDPVDPRLDPFVRSAAALFHTADGDDEYEILYIPRDRSILLQYVGLRRLLTGVPFRLVGWQPIIPAISALAVLIALVPAWSAVRRRRVMTALIVVLAVLYAFANGVGGTVRAVLLGLSVIYAQARSFDLERELLVHRRWPGLDPHSRAMVWLLCVALAAAAVSLVIGDAPERTAAVLSFLMFLTGLVAVWAAAVVVQSVRVRTSEHPLFAPRSILPDRATFPGAVWALGMTVASLGAIAFVADGQRPLDDLVVPVPAHHALAQQVPREGEDVDRLLEVLNTAGALEEPLSTAGFLAHRWFQQSMLFGGAFEVPSIGDSVTLMRFRRDAGTLAAWHESVMVFDRQWVLSQFAAGSTGVYRLFVEEHGAFDIVWESVTIPSVTPGYVMRLLLLLVVAHLPVFVSMRLPYRSLLDTVVPTSRSERP